MNETLSVIAYALAQTGVVILFTVWLTLLANGITEGGPTTRKHVLIAPDLAIAAITVAIAWGLGTLEFEPDSKAWLGFSSSMRASAWQITMVMAIAAVFLIWAIRDRQLVLLTVQAVPPSVASHPTPTIWEIIWLNRLGLIPLSIALLFATSQTNPMKAPKATSSVVLPSSSTSP